MGNKAGKSEISAMIRNPNEVSSAPSTTPSSSGTSGLATERATQELAALLVIGERKEVVSKIVYGIDNDGDFSMVLHAGGRPDHKYGVVVKIADKDNLTWQESRAIRAAVKFGERFTKLNDEEFNRWREHLKTADDGAVHFNSDSSKSVIIFVPKSVGRTFKGGRITQMKITIDKDQDFIVSFQTDVEKYIVIVNHTLRDGSFADLEAQAFADVVHIAEPGDKMDDHIFLHYMAKLRNKYHMLKVVRNGGMLVVHIVPTQLSVEEAGIPFESSVNLPSATDEAVDWSPETQARVAAADASSGPDIANILGTVLDGMAPLAAERLKEEAMAAVAVTQKLDIILKTYYGFDQDGDFSVIINSAARPDFNYVICVKIKDRTNLTWKEVRAMRDAVQLGERGTKITSGDFDRWKVALNQKHSSASMINGNGQQVILVRPEQVDYITSPGKIRKMQLGMDSDKDFVLLFETDADKYAIIVNHDEREKSFSAMQCKGFADALLVAEPGDKLDDEMFLQYCARLKRKHHLLKMIRKDGTLVAHLVPTSLDEASAGVSFTSDVPLPAAHQDSVDWSAATLQRIAVIASPIDVRAPANANANA